MGYDDGGSRGKSAHGSCRRNPGRKPSSGFFPSTLAYKKALTQATANLKKALDSGVTIAFGTDTGPAARFQGYFEHMELSMMAAAGLTPEQVLRSATGDAARCLGLGEVGTIESGKWADFIVLNEDPLAEMAKLWSIDSVWISGNRVPQGASE